MAKRKKQSKVVEDEQPAVYTENGICWSSAYKAILQKFIKDALNIKRIAIIGFGDGIMTEIFLKSREDTIVVAFEPINKSGMWEKANQMYQDYPNRFMLISGVVSSNIALYSTLTENRTTNSAIGCFDLIFVAASFNPLTARNDILSCLDLAYNSPKCPETTILMVDDICPAYSYGDQAFSTWNELVLSGRIKETCNLEIHNSNKINVGKAKVVKIGNEVKISPDIGTRAQQYWNGVLSRYLKSIHSPFLLNFIRQYGIDIRDLQFPSDSKGICLTMLMQALFRNPACQSTIPANMFEQDDTGIIQLNSFWFKIEHAEDGEYYYRVIVCCIESKEMTLLFAKTMNNNLIEISESLITRDYVLDLNRRGRRWEGSVLDNKPFGYGIEYNEEDNMVYEGFVYKGERICYCIEYNDDVNNNREIYRGQYLHNARNGKGITYDLSGEVDYDGEWENNMPVDRTKQITNTEEHKASIFVLPDFPDYTITYREIRISSSAPGKEYQISKFNICPFFSRLQSLEITGCNNNEVFDFVIDGMLYLQTITIGDDCFSAQNHFSSDYSVVSIKNCYALKKLNIGKNAFKYYDCCEFFNLPCLSELTFGEESFSCTSELKVESGK